MGALKITNTKTEGLSREYLISVPHDQYQEQVNAKLAEIAKTVRLPGFRPGKAPLQVVSQRYGDSVKSEALENTLKSSIEQTYKQENIRAVQQPNVALKTFEDGKDLEYTLSLEIMPEIPEVDTKKIKLEELVVPVSDEQLDEEIQRLIKEHKDFAETEDGYTAKKGDLVTIDFNATIDGEPFEGNSQNDMPVEIGSNEFLADFSKGLTGVKVGDEKTFPLTFPDDYKAEVAGKTADFSVKVKRIAKSVKIKTLKALAEKQDNEDLKDPEAYKANVRTRMEDAQKRQARELLQLDLLNYLDANYNFDLPSSILAPEKQVVAQSLLQDENKAAKDPKQPYDTLTKPQKTKADKLAARRVKLGLLLADIGQRNNIQITENEIQQAIYMRAFSSGNPQAFLEYFSKNPQAIDQIRAPLFESKAINYLVDNATIKTKQVSQEEFDQAEKDKEAASNI